MHKCKHENTLIAFAQKRVVPHYGSDAFAFHVNGVCLDCGIYIVGGSRSDLKIEDPWTYESWYEDILLDLGYTWEACSPYDEV